MDIFSYDNLSPSISTTIVHMIEPLYRSVKIGGPFKSMWNTMEYKKDSFSDALDEVRETHWERVPYAINFEMGAPK